jgi:hypothetical protein
LFFIYRYSKGYLIGGLFIFKDYLPSVGDPFGEPKTNSKPAASPLFFVPIIEHFKSFGFT